MTNVKDTAGAVRIAAYAAADTAYNVAVDAADTAYNAAISKAISDIDLKAICDDVDDATETAMVSYQAAYDVIWGAAIAEANACQAIEAANVTLKAYMKLNNDGDKVHKVAAAAAVSAAEIHKEKAREDVVKAEAAKKISMNIVYDVIYAAARKFVAYKALLKLIERIIR